MMKGKNNIETERTILRNLNVADAASFYALNLDEEVLKFTGDKPFDSIESAKMFLENYDQYQKYGVGRFAVIEKSTSKFMGWCGLKYSPDQDEYDIGFRFFRAHWNQGFATETAKRCLVYGFEELKINSIVGRAMKQNIASIKVLEKIGMNFERQFDFEGTEGVLFRVSREIT